MKKSDQTESEALQRLMKDPLKEFAPEFLGEVEMEGESIPTNQRRKGERRRGEREREVREREGEGKGR